MDMQLWSVLWTCSCSLVHGHAVAVGSVDIQLRSVLWTCTTPGSIDMQLRSGLWTCNCVPVLWVLWTYSCTRVYRHAAAVGFMDMSLRSVLWTCSCTPGSMDMQL